MAYFRVLRAEETRYARLALLESDDLIFSYLGLPSSLKSMYMGTPKLSHAAPHGAATGEQCQDAPEIKSKPQKAVVFDSKIGTLKSKL